MTFEEAFRQLQAAFGFDPKKQGINEMLGAIRDLRRVQRAAKKLLAEPDSTARLEELRAMVEMADETAPVPSKGGGG